MYSSLYSIKCVKEFVDEYVAFIESCKGKELPDYIERHHILPKSLFPEFAKVKANIIKLSAGDHFRAHMILAKAFGGPMWVAVNRLTHNQYGDRVITAEEYELIKVSLSTVISERLVDEWSSGKRSKETISNATRLSWSENRDARVEAIRAAVNDEFRQKSGHGAKVSWADEHIRERRMVNMTKAMNTDDYKAKHSKNQTERMKDPALRAKCGHNKGKVYPIVTCPHCNKTGGESGMKAKHFNNCKKRAQT